MKRTKKLAILTLALIGGSLATSSDVRMPASSEVLKTINEVEAIAPQVFMGTGVQITSLLGELSDIEAINNGEKNAQKSVFGSDGMVSPKQLGGPSRLMPDEP